MHPIQEIVAAQKCGIPAGIWSCCSANPYVLRAALLRGKAANTPVLIESTANQVDQYGGYSGMRPADFYAFVQSLAVQEGMDASMAILGGDHLGPLTFAHLPEEKAMAEAEELVRQYVLAGFTKIHLDTSMRLFDDPKDRPLSDEVISRRGARLCRVAEDAYQERLKQFPNAQAPVYIIGSEVPIPGGAQEEEAHLKVTSPEACEKTIAAFEAAFTALSLSDAWQRVAGVVVQPGVEFGDAQVDEYDREAARKLTNALARYPHLVFEGHSTDYQTKEKLREMVEDGIAILKVGPALTFSLREGLFALAHMERELCAGNAALSGFEEALEDAMLQDPAYWKKHYHGDEASLHFKRRFSFSDRARYYLPVPAVAAAISRLLRNLRTTGIPLSLLSQYMPLQYLRVSEGTLCNDPEALLLDHIGDCIDTYLYATRGAAPFDTMKGA